MKIDIANNWGLDKLKWDERIEWFDQNESQLDTLVNKADSPALFYAGVQAWKAHKMIGQEVAADVVALVKVRNQIAQKLGYENYHTMNMTLSKQNPETILALFNELDSLTYNAFAQLKGDIDSYLSKRYKISADKLMPCG